MLELARAQAAFASKANAAWKQVGSRRVMRELLASRFFSFFLKSVVFMAVESVAATLVGASGPL